MATLSAEAARSRFVSAPVAVLGTVNAAGDPHLVPVTFALAGPDTLVSAVDHKPKRTEALARLANIAAHPSVSLLVDRYDDDWSALWWARADGRARVLAAPAPADAEAEPGRDGGSDGGTGNEPQLRRAAIAALVARYGQYATRPPAGAILVIDVARWSGWAAQASIDNRTRQPPSGSGPASSVPS